MQVKKNIHVDSEGFSTISDPEERLKKNAQHKSPCPFQKTNLLFGIIDTEPRTARMITALYTRNSSFRGIFFGRPVEKERIKPLCSGFGTIHILRSLTGTDTFVYRVNTSPFMMCDWFHSIFLSSSLYSAMLVVPCSIIFVPFIDLRS